MNCNLLTCNLGSQKLIILAPRLDFVGTWLVLHAFGLQSSASSKSDHIERPSKKAIELILYVYIKRIKINSRPKSLYVYKSRGELYLY